MGWGFLGMWFAGSFEVGYLCSVGKQAVGNFAAGLAKD